MAKGYAQVEDLALVRNMGWPSVEPGQKAEDVMQAGELWCWWKLGNFSSEYFYFSQ